MLNSHVLLENTPAALNKTSLLVLTFFCYTKEFISHEEKVVHVPLLKSFDVPQFSHKSISRLLRFDVSLKGLVLYPYVIIHKLDLVGNFGKGAFSLLKIPIC